MGQPAGEDYTFIAYRPSHEDYCRGCLMQSWSSDFMLEAGLTRNQVTTLVANTLAANAVDEPRAPEWDFYVLRRGVPIIHEGRAYHDGWYDGPANQFLVDPVYRAEVEAALVEPREILAGRLTPDGGTDVPPVRQGRAVELD